MAEQQQTNTASDAALAYGRAKAPELIARLNTAGGLVPVTAETIALILSLGWVDGFHRGKAVGHVEALLASCANDAMAAS